MSLGRITSGIIQSELVLKTVDFVRQQLPAWRDDPYRRNREHSEDKLNSQLCKFLNSRARTEFPMIRFDREEYQSERRQVDFAVCPAESMVIGAKPYSIYESYLVLEGKRLPAPSRIREKEYVTGYAQRTGGIQRFKLNLHGNDLDIAVMIGYVQTGHLRNWHTKINKWICELANNSTADGCIWNENEKLEPLNADASKGIGTCRSVHSRNAQKPINDIKIHHLWILMNIT